MPPSEPVAPNCSEASDETPEDIDDSIYENEQNPNYQPNFKKTDWFVQPLLEFDADNTNMDDVYKAVSYWTDIALELKANNYPIAEGIDNWKQFDKNLQQKWQMLDDFLDLIINKRLYLDERRHEVIKVLIAQGMPYLEFKEKMSKVDFSLKCNMIWENHAVAYRCNTCALTPCMSLCEACFDANGHAGHDYTRFFSREGGACDCGNQDVIKAIGNCPEHGDESKRPKYDMNDVCLAEFIIAKMLVRLFLDYRGWSSRYKEEENSFLDSNHSDDSSRHPMFDIGLFTEKDAAQGSKLIELMQEFSNYGGPMRLIISQVLLSKELYTALTEKTGEHYDESGRVELNLDWRTSHHFMDDRESVLLPDAVSMNFPLVEALPGTECYTLLDELIFWINRQLFPQNLVNFGLGMLSEPGYRDAFAYRFFAWYPICGKVISDLCESQADHARTEDRVSPACSRAVHVTVQMLSSPSVCKELNRSTKLVKTIFDVTQFLICEQLVESEMNLHPSNIFVERIRDFDDSMTLRTPWEVMTMRDNAAISQHGYWFVMGDIQNVLTHTELAVDAVLDEECFGGSYMNMMSEMQGMNVIWRVVSGNALEIDGGDEVQRAYTLEFETLAVTLFNIVAAIQQENSVIGAQRFFDHVKNKLKDWFQHLMPLWKPEDVEEKQMKWGKVTRAQAYAVSFHIPLHRHMSTALTHFNELEGFYPYIQEHLLDDELFVRLLLIHPLRVQVARTEINCGMWVRNGAQARMSSLIYSQWNVSSAFQTPDVDLIRFCGAHIDKEHFAKVLAVGYGLTEKVRYRQAAGHYLLEEKKELFKGSELEGDVEPTIADSDRELLRSIRDIIRGQPEVIEDVVKSSNNSQAQITEIQQQILNALTEFTTSTLTIDFEVPMMPAPPKKPRKSRRGPFPDSDDEAPNMDAPNRPQVPAPQLFEEEDFPRAPVLREPEWIDPMFWGMLKLTAELVVVRVNSGATSEEHYRSEMVNCMAMGNVPYSRLRASISEKGSRGSELIDKHFESILKEIGDFIEPTEATNYLQQGSYQLKTSVWNTELCPVFFMMRSTSMKQAREVFAKMEARERKNASEKKGDGVKLEDNFWVPFRLIDFSEQRRHPGIAQIYKVLLTERFILNCIAVLVSGSNCTAKFHDCTMQLAVYLLTLGVKYAEQYEGGSKSFMRDIYHTPFKLVAGNDHSFLTPCYVMLRLLEDDARAKESLIPVLRNVLAGVYNQEKVTGGKMIYLARFVTILANFSPTCRKMVEEKLAMEEILLNKLVIEEESKKKADPAKLAAKEASRKRMAAIMQKSAQKSALTMQKLMAKEGMSAAEVEKVDPSQQNRKLYECPICGEQEAPNTVDQPFGIMVKLSTNFVCEEQIDANCTPIRELLEYDKCHSQFEENKAQMMTRRNFTIKRRNGIEKLEIFEKSHMSKVRAPPAGTDLKTCGHAAHMACFNAYRASLYETRQRPVERREVGCPLCRYTVNTIIPIAVDKPYDDIKMPPSPMNNSSVWKAVCQILRKAKGAVFDSVDKNVLYDSLYSSRDGGALHEMVSGRMNSADSAERHMSSESCTVSTTLATMAVTMVERASLLRGMGILERRKHARTGLTAHIMIASVATSKDIDFEVSLHALTSLLGKIPTSSATSESPRNKTTTKKEPYSVDGLSSDEMSALTTKSTRKRSMNEPLTDCRMTGPLFALDPKPTLVRMISVLIDNQSITKETQQEIAAALIRATTSWVASYTMLCLILRLGAEKVIDLATGSLKIEGLPELEQKVVETIAKAVTDNRSSFDFMVVSIASPDVEVTDSDFIATLQKAIVDFLRFSSELLYHCGLGELETVEFIHDPQIGYEETLHVMGYDASSIHLIEYSNYWAKTYRNNLNWMATLSKVYQPCISEPLTWKPRRILRPPAKFEELFTRYFHRECINCTRSPNNPVVCLMCGELLCLDDCCRVHYQESDDRLVNMSEMEAHAENCSSSSGLFISINSSMIIVVRGKQATIWGTVYLDAHKEEDRNLRRGKPLFLCESRLKWLETDWAEQEWQRIYQWFNLNNSHAFINHIRDCHLLHHLQ